MANKIEYITNEIDYKSKIEILSISSNDFVSLVFYFIFVRTKTHIINAIFQKSEVFA